MSDSYVLTEAAEADVRALIRYTRAQWGVAQTRIYVAALERGMARLAAGEGPFKDMSALYPQLRMMHTESPVLEMLKAAKAAAQDIVREKKNEISQIDRAIAAIVATELPLTRKDASDTPATINQKLSAVSQIRHARPVGDAIVEAVEAGMRTPVAVLDYLSTQMGIHTTIGSVRARLSPLKKEGRIDHDGQGWVPKVSTKEQAKPFGNLDL